mgnify:CR=1 FL=1
MHSFMQLLSPHGVRRLLALHGVHEHLVQQRKTFGVGSDGGLVTLIWQLDSLRHEVLCHDLLDVIGMLLVVEHPVR